MERSKKKGLFIGLAVVLLLAIGALAVVFLLPKKADEKLFVSKVSPNGVNATITASYQFEGGEETYFTDMAGNTELVLTPDIVSSKELSAPIEIKLVEVFVSWYLMVTESVLHTLTEPVLLKAALSKPFCSICISA